MKGTGLDPGTLETVLDAVPGWVCVLNRTDAGQLRLVYASSAIEAWFGLRPEEVVADPCALVERVEPPDRGRLVKALETAARTGEGFRLELRAHDRSRQPHAYVFRARVRKDHRDTPVIIGHMMPVAEAWATPAYRNGLQKVLHPIATGAPLAEALHRLCELIEEQMPGAIATVVLLDPATRSLRYGAAPAMDPEFMTALEGVRVGPETGSCGTALYFGIQVVSSDIASDPKWAPYSSLAAHHGLAACWSTPFAGPDGLPKGSLAVYFSSPRSPGPRELDLLAFAAQLAGIASERAAAQTALHRNEEQLRQAQKMEAIGQLAGGIAHDFNNILTVIKGSASLLREALEGTADEPEARAIQEAADRGEAVTRQLLAFGRRQTWDPHAVDIAAVLTELDGILRRMLTSRTEFRVAVQADAPPVWIDRVQLEQVIINLVVNARDAMPDGGTCSVEVRTHPEEARVLMEVVDDGIGMDDGTRARIFEPFFSTKGPGRGSGLGLSMVYGIVERAGGWVDVISAPGQGSRFVVSLPASSDRVRPAGGLSSLGRVRVKSSSTPRVILLAEDDGLVRRLAARVLRARRFEVVEVEDGRAALEVLESRDGRVDLVLSDVVMPRMTGTELLAAIRRRWPVLPVLLMSGYSEDLAQLNGCLGEGVGLIPKPFSPSVLVRRVRDAMALGGPEDEEDAAPS